MKGYVEISDRQSAYHWWKEQGCITELNATTCAPLAGFLAMQIFNPFFLFFK